MAAVTARSGVAALQRRRDGSWLEPLVAETGHQGAVESAAAHLQQLAIPVARQIDLELHARRARIHGTDPAPHLAVFTVEIALSGCGYQSRAVDARAPGWQSDLERRNLRGG